MLGETLLCQIPGEDPLLRPIFEKMVQFDGGGVSYASLRPNHFPEHTDPNFKVAVPFEGTSIQATWQTASGQRQQQYVKHGDVSILPANLPHETILENNLEIVVISIKPSLIEQVSDELDARNVEIPEKWAVQDTLIRQLGVELRREFQLEFFRPLYAESVIHVLATRLIRHYSVISPIPKKSTTKLPPQKLQQVVDYINIQLDQNITLVELSEVAKMSPYRFSRAFKQSTGLPPHQYLLSCRIERAKTLLSNSQRTISEIAYELGFASHSHFTLTFRRFTGTTPQVYRDNL